jgi:hypothetical protein
MRIKPSLSTEIALPPSFPLPTRTITLISSFGTASIYIKKATPIGVLGDAAENDLEAPGAARRHFISSLGVLYALKFGPESTLVYHKV